MDNTKFMSLCFKAAEFIQNDTRITPKNKVNVSAWLWDNADFPLEAFGPIVDQVMGILKQDD